MTTEILTKIDDPTSNRRGPAHQLPALPTNAELAAELRAGVTIQEIAKRYQRAPEGLVTRLGRAGWGSDGNPEYVADRVELQQAPRHFDPQDWDDERACQKVNRVTGKQMYDPELWFPEKGDNGSEAKRICGLCPVRVQCLQWAIDNDQQWGIWGGLSLKQRRKVAAGKTTIDAAISAPRPVSAPSATELAARRDAVKVLHGRGLNDVQIAKQLHCSRDAIQRDRRALGLAQNWAKKENVA